MARTDVRKIKQAVKVECPIPGFRDEWHLIRPSTREVLANVRDKSQVKEWDRGALVEKSDPHLFDQEYLDYIWAGWSDTVEIQHADGTIESPAAPTLANKMELANNRPIDFLLWLQATANELAVAVHHQQEEQRDTFQEPHSLPPGPPESQL